MPKWLRILFIVISTLILICIVCGLVHLGYKIYLCFQVVNELLGEVGVKYLEAVIIDSQDVIDATTIIDPPQEYIDKYSALFSVDKDILHCVSEYMAINNLKLKSGRQTFVNYQLTYEKLISELEFEIKK